MKKTKKSAKIFFSTRCPQLAQGMLKKKLIDYLKATGRENETWIMALHLLGEGDCLRVVFPHALFAPWFLEHKKKSFEKTVHACFPETFTHIFYTLNTEPKEKKKKQTPSKDIPQEESILNASDEYTFENFVHNQKNSLPLGTLKRIATSGPGRLFNPVILCGGTGTGKTHLLHALANTLPSKGKLNILSARELTDFFAEEANPHDFWKRNTALFIDDIHGIKDSPILQETLIYFFDACPKNRQLFLTFLGTPEKLDSFDQRLASRMKSGLVLTLTEPDIDVRLKFAQAQCSDSHLELTHQQLLCIAQNSSLCRHVQGLILRIQAYQKIHGRLPQGDLEAIVQHGAIDHTLSTQDILSCVSEHMHVSVDAILSTKRQADLVLARQMAMYICRNRLGLSYPELGKIFGGKDHSTVIHAIKKITQLLAEKADLHQLFTAITKDL